jgi:hypothetical protein
MRRRDFIVFLSGATFTQPIVAFAQQTERIRTVGILLGDNLDRWSEGRPERVAEIAAEFVRQKVDVRQ